MTAFEYGRSAPGTPDARVFEVPRPSTKEAFYDAMAELEKYEDRLDIMHAIAGFYPLPELEGELSFNCAHTDTQLLDARATPLSSRDDLRLDVNVGNARYTVGPRSNRRLYSADKDNINRAIEMAYGQLPLTAANGFREICQRTKELHLSHDPLRTAEAVAEIVGHSPLPMGKFSKFSTDRVFANGTHIKSDRVLLSAGANHMSQPNMVRRTITATEPSNRPYEGVTYQYILTGNRGAEYIIATPEGLPVSEDYASLSAIIDQNRANPNEGKMAEFVRVINTAIESGTVAA